jgi:hypothetical protein
VSCGIELSTTSDQATFVLLATRQKFVFNNEEITYRFMAHPAAYFASALESEPCRKQGTGVNRYHTTSSRPDSLCGTIHVWQHRKVALQSNTQEK